MADTITPVQRSAVMRRVRAKDTTPELFARRAFHKQGFRYRLHVASLPGKPDLVFKKYRTVVFVHGCFWHWHGCKRSRMPGSNVPYWTKKIARNIERDQEHHDALRTAGWSIAILWECAIKQAVPALIERMSGTGREKAGEDDSRSGNSPHLLPGQEAAWVLDCHQVDGLFADAKGT